MTQKIKRPRKPKQKDPFDPKANAAKCLNCGMIIQSRFRHDYQSCRCPDYKRIAVDGGSDYARRVFGLDAQWEEWINGEWKPAPEMEMLRKQK